MVISIPIVVVALLANLALLYSMQIVVANRQYSTPAGLVAIAIAVPSAGVGILVPIVAMFATSQDVIAAIALAVTLGLSARFIDLCRHS